jgi:hypothetical protein
MSKLTETLDSFYNLLCLEYPEIASRLQPGLTREEIDEKVKSLGFSLPEEVYELYQWRNGIQENIFIYLNSSTGYVPNVARFLSLEQLLNPEMIKVKSFLIPFVWVISEGLERFVAVFLERKEVSVIHYDNPYLKKSKLKNDFDSDIKYANFANLISIISECYEEALLPSPNQGLLLIDKHKFEQIHLKYKVN